MHGRLCFLALFFVFSSVIPAAGQQPGDRIGGLPRSLGEWIPAALPSESYRVGPGDILSINVQGKASLNYQVRPQAEEGTDPNEVSVSPSGDIYIPLAGKISVTGNTTAEVENLIHSRLGKYIKEFNVSVTVSKVRTVNIWISGEVENPGPQILPAVSTVSLAALQAGIKPTGSTRRVTLVRRDTQRIVDLYRITITGNTEDDIALEPGDSIHVPAISGYIDIVGEVTRPGRYEIVGFSQKSDAFRIRDAARLALGLLPSAAFDKASVERVGHDGKRVAIDIKLDAEMSSPDAEMVLQPGDSLVIPSISAFQPMIRLIGEFKGDGVYQRATGSTKEDVENKSGIYLLKQGQTVRDVIIATGGVTPQADLKRARIERREADSVRTIPVDLERLLIRDDSTADVALVNGDSLILPAVADRVHVFGEITKPGSYIYSPNRRLIDYIGDAGGPTERAKLTEVSIVRGGGDQPRITRADARSAMRGTSVKGNPVLEPGDIVYIPSKFVSGWRDALQLLFTSVSLGNLLTR